MLGYLFNVPLLMKEGPVKHTNNKIDHLASSLYWVEKKKLVRLSKKVTFKYLRCNEKQREQKPMKIQS